MEPQQVTPTVPPPSPVLEQKPPHSNKMFKILLLIFLVLLLGAVVTYAFQNYQQQTNLVPPTEPTPTQVVEETNEWETYGVSKYDDKYGSAYNFSIEYPSSFTIREHDYGTGFDFSLLSTDYQSPETGAIEEIITGARIDIQPLPKQNFSTLDQWISKYYLDPITSKSKVNSTEPLLLSNGLTGMQFQLEDEDTNLLRYVRIVSNKKDIYKFDLVMRNNDSKKSEYLVLFDQILSTFRFVEEELSITPSASTVTGSITVYQLYETAINVALIAKSTTGNVTQMKVWIDTADTATWEAFSNMRLVPWKVGENYVYAQFKDDKGNISEIYSTEIIPYQGKMAE